MKCEIYANYFVVSRQTPNIISIQIARPEYRCHFLAGTLEYVKKTLLSYECTSVF
jgi:hypothetical protein